MDATAGTTAPRVQGWLQGVVSLFLPSLTADQVEIVRGALRLYCRDLNNPGPRAFTAESGSWLHVPRGWWVTRSAAYPFLQTAAIQEARSNGHPLPAGSRVNTTFGVAPYPAGQPAFIDAIVEGCRRSGIGGLALAPTRSGKTYCGLEAACRLGHSTLILVDMEILANQWAAAIGSPVNERGEPKPCVVDVNGRPVKVGFIWGDRFDLPPEYPFVVGMIQTVARRQVDEAARAAFGCVILDEAQTAPTSQAMEALQRFSAHYTIGLTATPNRADGLTDAIGWLAGPEIAQLDRAFEADVFFLRRPWANAKVPTRAGDKLRVPQVVRPDGVTNVIEVEKSLMADEARVAMIADEVAKGVNAGRQVLVLVGMRDHAMTLAHACQDRGLSPAIFMGGATERARMRANPVIATFGSCAKGADFDPPPTLCVIASPRSDVRQAMGRALQPQAPHRPMILDVVDDEPRLIRMAKKRRRQYREKRLTLKNGVDR